MLKHWVINILSLRDDNGMFEALNPFIIAKKEAISFFKFVILEGVAYMIEEFLGELMKDAGKSLKNTTFLTQKNK